MLKSIPTFLYQTDINSCAGSIAAVSRARCFAPQNQNMPANSIAKETTKKAMFMFHRSRIAPISGGDAMSPKRWMTKIFNAKAVARILGEVTLASAVFVGPVLKNRKKTAKKIQTHAPGNGI